MVVLPAVFPPRGYPGAAGPSPAGVLAHPRRIGPPYAAGRRAVPLLRNRRRPVVDAHRHSVTLTAIGVRVRASTIRSERHCFVMDGAWRTGRTGHRGNHSLCPAVTQASGGPSVGGGQAAGIPARLIAETTALMEAVVIDESTPTPHTTLPPMAHSR